MVVEMGSQFKEQSCRKTQEISQKVLELSGFYESPRSAVNVSLVLFEQSEILFVSLIIQFINRDKLK